MSVTVNVNGVAISYPRTGDVEWGDEATEFAIQVGSVLQKIGQGNQTPTTDNIAISPGNLTVTTGNTDLGGTLDVTGATNLDSTLDVTGATNLDSTLDVTGVTTIVDDLIVDTDTLFVDVSTDRVGINTATPTVALDVVGDIKSSAGITGASATLTNLTVDTNLIITNSTDNRVGINTTSPTVALDVTGDVKQSGQVLSSNGTVSQPAFSFSDDPDSGIYRIGADNLGIAVNATKIADIQSLGILNGTLGTDYRNLIQVVQGQVSSPRITRTNTSWTTGANTNFNLVLQGSITPKSSSSIIKISGFITDYTGSGSQSVFLYLYRNTSSYGTPLSTSQAGTPTGTQLGSLMNQGNGNTSSAGVYTGTSPIIAWSTGHLANTEYFISCWLKSGSNVSNIVNNGSTLSEMYFEEWL